MKHIFNASLGIRPALAAAFVIGCGSQAASTGGAALPGGRPSSGGTSGSAGTQAGAGTQGGFGGGSVGLAGSGGASSLAGAGMPATGGGGGGPSPGNAGAAGSPVGGFGGMVSVAGAGAAGGAAGTVGAGGLGVAGQAGAGTQGSAGQGGMAGTGGWPGSMKDFLRVDYYVWERHDRKGIRPAQLQSLDVLIYFKIPVSASGNLNLSAKAVAHLNELKKVTNPNTAFWIGVTTLDALLAGPDRIMNFIDSVRRASEMHGFRGLDIDWETGVSVADYVRVVSEISDALRGPEFQIANSVGFGTHYRQKTLALQSKLDWTHVQVYYSTGNAWSAAEMAAALKNFHNEGVPPERLALGLPIYASQDASSRNKQFPFEVGYNNILNRGASSTQNTWTNPAGVTYYYSGTPLIREKTKYALDSGYRGVFTFELTLDAAYSSGHSIAQAVDNTVSQHAPAPQP